jgi:hypothetical protein
MATTPYVNVRVTGHTTLLLGVAHACAFAVKHCGVDRERALDAFEWCAGLLIKAEIVR